MAAMQILALLVVVTFGLAASQIITGTGLELDASCPAIPLECKESASVCWSHDDPSYGQTCAELRCNDQGIALLVRSPKDATRVVIEGVQPDPSASQYDSGCQSEADISVGWPVELQNEQTPAGANLGVGAEPNMPVVPAAEPYDEDYAEMMADHDPNADYAAQFARSKRDANEDYAQQLLEVKRAKVQPGGVFKAAHGQCGQAAQVQSCTSYSQGETVVKVTEYLYVNGVVELVTRTVLRLKCSADIKAPSHQEVTAPVKEAATAQCRQTNYGIKADLNCANCVPEFINGIIYQDVHVSADEQVGWRAKIISLDRIDIVQNGWATVSPNLGQAVRNNYWDPSTDQYDFSSDLAVNVVNQVTVSAEVEYCLHGPSLAASGDNEVCGIPKC